MPLPLVKIPPGTNSETALGPFTLCRYTTKPRFSTSRSIFQRTIVPFPSLSALIDRNSVWPAGRGGRLPLRVAEESCRCCSSCLWAITGEQTENKIEISAITELKLLIGGYS